mgnify:CR=1 FL=1
MSRVENYLRSLPFFLAVVVYMLILYIKPESLQNIVAYVSYANPEESFSLYGWSMYSVIIPCCIAGLSRWEKNLPLIITVLLIPVGLLFAYWLWEILGWFVILCLFSTFMAVLQIFDKYDKPVLIICAVTAGLYSIMRVLNFFKGNDSAIEDMLLVGVPCACMLVTSIIDIFVHEEEFNPSMLAVLYLFFATIVLVGLSQPWKENTLFMESEQKEEYSDALKQATSLQRESNYRKAATYYQQAAMIHNKDKNIELTQLMISYADSIETTLIKKIPQDLESLKNMTPSYYQFSETVLTVEKDIVLLENNASSVATAQKVKKFKQQLRAYRLKK